MKWFQEYTRFATGEEKLLMKYGYSGFGLYMYCKKIIAGLVSKDNITFELDHDSEILAHKGKMDTLLVEEIIRYIISLGLFEYNEDTARITCYDLLKALDTATSKNPEIKSIVSKTKKSIEFIPPFAKEVTEYAKSCGYNIDGEKFINYYSTNGWKDKNNNPVKNWKLKLQSSWFNDNNMIIYAIDFSNKKLSNEEHVLTDNLSNRNIFKDALNV